MYQFTSAGKLQEIFPNLTPGVAKQIRKIIMRKPLGPEIKLLEVSKLLDAYGPPWFHGVERLVLEDGYKFKDEWLEEQREDLGTREVLLYCNNGHTYQVTIAYDVVRDCFLTASWGNWYEVNIMGWED
jgi:hypothetical protein